MTDTKLPEHGDYACTLALAATKVAGKPPRAIAELLQASLLSSEGHPFQAIEIAGPGFLNLRLRPQAISAWVSQVFAQPETFGNSAPPKSGRKMNVEFVSVNPNGPITVGSGRGAAFGDTLSRVLDAAGDDVAREYYINDGVNSEQMRLFAESVKAHALGVALPENGYKGEYVADVAKRVLELHPDAAQNDQVSWWQTTAQELMIERQRTDLEEFNVHFDLWFSEQSLHNSGRVQKALEQLESSGAADRESIRNETVREGKNSRLEQIPQESGPLWLRSTRFGDDKDRVLTRSDGRPAYIAADVAYLENKLGERGFDRALLIVGPDHHGYITRMYAMCQALGYPLSKFEMIIFQLVRFTKDGKPAPMRKRDGNIYELRDLIHELGANIAPAGSREEQKRVGADVARFFYAMRSHDTSMDFDIDLATKQSDENPVFYVQYAHARIRSVIAKAHEAGFSLNPEFDPTDWLTHDRELSLTKKILDLPHEVARIALDYGVHRLATYAVELARTYHHFYDACRVVQIDQPELTQARLQLSEASAIALRRTLWLMGISAPERMHRPAELTEVIEESLND